MDAILPAGTLSGAPKIRACEIIAELEKEKEEFMEEQSDILILPEM